MATSNASPKQTDQTQTSSVILTKEVFDFNTFENVRVGTQFTPSAPITNTAEALAYLGNDESKLVALINAAKEKAEEKEALSRPFSEFHFFVDPEDESKGLESAPAEVEQVDEETYNKVELDIARNAHGFARGKGSENNQAARAAARKQIKETPEIKAFIRMMSKMKADGNNA